MSFFGKMYMYDSKNKLEAFFIPTIFYSKKVQKHIFMVILSNV